MSFLKKQFAQIARYAHYRLGLVAGAALVGWTGSWHWVPELFSHFFLQYALLFLLLTPLVFHSRAGVWRWAALAAAVLVWAAILPAWLPPPDAEIMPASGKPITLLQFNALRNTAPLAEWLLRHGQDIDAVLILEAGPSFAADVKTLSRDFPYHIERLADDPFGIALISRHPFADVRILELIGPRFTAIDARLAAPAGPLRLVGIHPPPPITEELANSRDQFMEKLADYLEAGTASSSPSSFTAIDARLATPAGPLRLVGIHPPSPVTINRATSRERFMEKLADYLKAGSPSNSPSSLPTVVFGDFNSTPWSPQLRAFLSRSGLRDAQRGRGLLSTWPSLTARYADFLGIPIDMTLVSSAVSVESRRVGPDLGSDHLPVLTRIAY